MRIIAILNRVLENPDYSVDRWTETRSFDEAEPIKNIFDWAKERRCQESDNIVLAVDQDPENKNEPDDTEEERAIAQQVATEHITKVVEKLKKMSA